MFERLLADPDEVVDLLAEVARSSDAPVLMRERALGVLGGAVTHTARSRCLDVVDVAMAIATDSEAPELRRRAVSVMEAVVATFGAIRGHAPIPRARAAGWLASLDKMRTAASAAEAIRLLALRREIEREVAAP